jgi:hypothetical protein
MAAGSLVGCQNPIAEFSCAHGRPRCQGRRGEPFSERSADPLQRKRAEQAHSLRRKSN